MIKAFRADDRLIHGQVQTVWISYHHVNRVMIIDSKVAKDPINMQILKLAKPTGIDLVVCAEDRAMELIAKDAAQPNARTFVIFKSVATAWNMKQRGLCIPSIVIGPNSAKTGAVQICKNTFFTQEEIAAADALAEAGTQIIFQLLPGDARTTWEEVKNR